MARKTKDGRPDPAKMRFEEATGELEAIIERIEQGDLGLEDSLAERRRGDDLIKRSRAILDAAEQELEQTRVDKAGGAETRKVQTRHHARHRDEGHQHQPPRPDPQRIRMFQSADALIDPWSRCWWSTVCSGCWS